ncbi:MAG: gamma-glutamylcyclotransferase, partial [Oscillospiraceae bacterium]|nr:gamma-glutamylcyclotransferase [Oscillospiraceae bacterium]
MFVFVYGSLKKGYWNDHHLEGANFYGQGMLQGYSLYHVSTFPGMVKSEDEAETVYGEVYEVDEEILRNLDILESEGVMYKRCEVPINLRGGKTVNAGTYTWLDDITPDMKKVVNNNWKRDLYLDAIRMPRDFSVSIGTDFTIQDSERMEEEAGKYTYLQYQFSEEQNGRKHVRTPFFNGDREVWLDAESMWQILDENGARAGSNANICFTHIAENAD